MSQKKLQVFVSSTSDVYMLILGGRYGSIEEESGKSYTQLEYEYAKKIEKPLFAVVINKDILGSRPSDFIEKDHPEQLENFRKIVDSNLRAEFSDVKDIKLAIHESLGQIQQDYDLIGWVRGDQQSDNLAEEMVSINKELRQLRNENEQLKKANQSRLPKLEIKINESSKLHFDFSVDEANYYKVRKPIENIPNHLTEFLTQEEVDKYNKQVAKIDKSAIEKYNALMATQFAVDNLQNVLNITLENTGNLKSKNLHITISFPDFVFVDDDSRYELAKYSCAIRDEALKVISMPKYNPLESAKLKYEESLGRFNRLFDVFPDNSTDKRPNYGSLPRIPQIPSLDGTDYLEKNKIIITRKELLHKMSIQYLNYILAPLRKGEGKITISLHCEEYLDAETIEIPITVS